MKILWWTEPIMMPSFWGGGISGKLFHIDFGYILGRDPKPLPPPMKLSKEMVEGMGGMQSEQYQEFRKQCYTAFLHLRRWVCAARTPALSPAAKLLLDLRLNLKTNKTR